MVIELVAGERPDVAGQRRPGLAAAVALAVVLVLVLTGPIDGAAGLARAWRGVTQEGFFWLTADAVYTIDTDTSDGLSLVRHDVGSGHVRWRHDLDGTLPTIYRRGDAILDSHFPPTPRWPSATEILDSASGAPIGSYPAPAMPLVYMADGVALLIDRAAPPPPPQPAGTSPFIYSPDYFDGQKETHRVVALDLDTGAVRWTRDVDAGATWALPGVHPWMEGFAGSDATWLAVLWPDHTLSTWDLATGATQRHTAIGPLDQWSYVVALADTVIVAASGWPQTVLSGYDPADLHRRWQFEVPGVPEATAWPISCVSALCLAWPYGVWAFDTSTGRPRWYQRVLDVFDAGQPLLTVATVDGLALVDVATGRLDQVPMGWRIAQPRPRGRDLVVARTASDGRISLGLLDQSNGSVVSLGDVGTISGPGRCQSTGTLAEGGYLACADGDVLRIWRIEGHPAGA